MTGSWALPPILTLIAEKVETSELRRVFNLGVGFVFVVPAADAARTRDLLSATGESPLDLGRVVDVPPDREFEARVEGWS